MSPAFDNAVSNLANFDPASFALRQQKLAGEVGLNAAQAAQTQQQTQLQQQQTQGAALQNQLVQQKIIDQKALGKSWAAWDQQADPDGRTIGPMAIRNGATPESVMAVEQHRVQYAASLANADKTTLENHKAKNDDFAGKIQAIIEAPTEQQDQMIASYKGDLLTDDPKAQIPDHFDLNMYKSLQKVHQYQSTQTDQALKSQQTKEATAKALQAEEETRKTKLTNDLLEHSQQGGDPSELTPGQHPIAAIGQGLPPNDPTMMGLINMYNQGRKMPILENGIARYPMAEKAMESMALYQKSIGEANNPQIRAGKVETAKQEELAKAPIMRENAIAQAKALREGDNPALAGVPPSAAASAVTAATKLDESYIKAREATESMGKLLDLADQSNVAAGANIPMVGVGATNAINGIRRINSAEISQYGSAGSLMQKIQGKLQGWTEGQPIPSSVRDDIRELHQQLGETAYKAYTQGIDSLNQRTGAKFGPTVPAPNIRKGAAAGGGMPRVATPADVAKLPRGTHFLDPNGVERIAR